MTSTDSPSPSEAASHRRRPTYALLLQDSEKWQGLWALLHDPVWASLMELLDAERYSHLEALQEGPQLHEDPAEHSITHLAIARWLRDVTDPETGLRAKLLAWKHEQDVGTLPRPNGDDPNAYMALDSEMQGGGEG